MRGLNFGLFLAMVISLVACGETGGADDTRLDQGQNLSDLGAADMVDSSGEEDAGDAGDALDMPAPNIPWVSFGLTDGREVVGELIAVYDTSRWWNPLGSLVYAVFDPRNFASYPGDKSIKFILSSDVANTDDSLAPSGVLSFRGFLRARMLHFRQPPFDGGSYVITGNNSYHLEEDGYGDFAWDFQTTDDVGRRFTQDGAANADYLVWDQPVFSGVRGEVIEIVSTGEDNTPGEHPELGTAINNLVGIALGGHYYAYYLHFRQDGISPGLRVGSRVEVGDELGRAGNSGVSLEPHIHVVLLWFDIDADRSYAVPAEFSDIEVSNTPTGPSVRYDWWVPQTGDWLSR